MKTKWQIFLSQEIAIEYKAATYCFLLYFFLACYQLFKGYSTVAIASLVEIVVVAYFISQIQVWLFDNFDEADQLRGRKLLGIVFCPILYGGFAYLFDWFDRHWLTLLCFVLFLLLEYLTIFYFNRLKRRIDSKHLNQLLKDYKERRD